MIDWNKGFKSFTFAWKGFRIIWKEEQNFRILTLVGLLIILLAAIFGFSYIELSLIIGSVTLVLSMEAVNTALEDTLNKIEPAHDPIIGKIKDIGAFFLVLVMLGAGTIGLLIFIHHFWH